MSDKSFGDCTNRNVVKNPLLSTAVTGLSIEDLTHNAVLLPAVPSQELITIQDQQNEAQNLTLRHLDHDITNYPSGDAASHQTHFKSPPHLTKTLLDNQKQTQNIINNENLIATKSKASFNSDDDFDVNEYFARLQGTRYVSAPLNSHLKEDQNANLPAEENLEEINLNEPEKKQNQDDFQHSLTADIAQNFSQLPSVLPQVASVVFSSFSNMLNLKSREQTPDDVKTYQHAQIPEMIAPLAAPDPPPQAMPPPLMEPPVSGNNSNYRITTKKKVYAQIPGLSSGDNQIHTYNTPPIGQTPYYFTPAPTFPENKEENFHISLEQSQSVQDKDRIEAESVQVTEKTFDVYNKNKIAEPSKDVQTQPTIIAHHEHKETNPINEFNQEIFKRDIEDTKVHENIFIPQTQAIPSNTFYPNQSREGSNVQQSLQSYEPNSEIQFSIGKTQVDLNQSVPINQFVPISQVSTSIIPPPPMFSSMPRKDSHTTDKSILPPSVARRIGPNQPVVKSAITSNTILPENIFIPNMPELQCASTEMHTNLEQHIQQGPVYNIPIGANRNETDTKISPKEYFGSSTSITPGFNPYIQTAVTATSQNIPNESIITPPKTIDMSSLTRPQKDLSKAEKERENRNPMSNIYQSSESNKYPPNIIDNNIIQQAIPKANIAPPMFFDPTSATQPNIGPSIIEDQSHFVSQNKMPQFCTNEFAPEPLKAVPEPPKVSSSLNYRMTKKRPQYYSGPIEGLGSISNNIKPTINPVQPNAYHGALFNPDQVQLEHNLPVNYEAPFQQETLAPFDINRPINLPTQSTNEPYITQKQMPQTDFNTAFDLSRPTTERYEQPQPLESKGFGIIGSLKSKLSSIDINKIQNSVTTFFDPAYNEPRIDPNKEKESNFQAFSGNYQNFPQHESATLEVFVPTVEPEYQPANPYNYQMQTLQTYPNQQYYPNQEYFNQSHNYSKDFYSGYHDNSNRSEAGANIPSIVEASHSGNNNRDIKSTNVESLFHTTNLCNKADSECIVDATQKTIDNVSQITDKKISVLDDFTVGAKQDENIISHLKPIVDSNNEEKIEETEKNYSLNKNYYSSSKTVIQPPISLFKEAVIENINNNINKDNTANNDIIHQLQSVADSTLKNVFDCKSPIVVESVLAKDIQEPFSTISNVSTDPLFTQFFDYQQPAFIIPEADNDKQTINVLPIKVDSTHTFFDYQVPKGNPLPRKTDDYFMPNNANTQNAAITKPEMLSESTELNSLCPLLQSKSENLQTNSSVFSGKSTLNETPLFSLFEQPSLLPPLPSFDLSKISSMSLPDPINEATEIKSLETKMNNVSLFENTENITKFERKSSFFDKTLPIEDDAIFVDNQVSDLNICETCREVSKSEEKEADLTTQLIENITAPIQLANPVEFPVIASTSVPDISDFSNQFAEISYIPEDIIETMKQPPSVELKEDNFNSAITFGWSSGDSQPSKAVTDHDYNFQADPSVIGFFDNKSLFFENVPTNASDEIKAEYKISKEDTIVLPRQLSVPTAPLEEDSNSDESGLDVHSIEQDAKKDFPIYEEFVIEPSETDDDKIEFKERERYSEESPQNVDTFTNRVERFKQMETSIDPPDVYETQKHTNALTLATSTSPAITIASYFDTGNYAVENHYKNSLTSPPSISFGANISSATSIPPGFEEEYKRKCSAISSKDIAIGLNVGNITYIPETSTQTPVSVSLTFTQPSNVAAATVVTTDTSVLTRNLVQEVVLPKTERLPAFSSIIEPKSQTVEREDNQLLVTEKTATESNPINDTLPDSINFFSSNEESTGNSNEYNNFSRLSSYFTTPPKPDHSKSFFELSQSQNHYRHKPDQFDSIQSNVKDFFDSSNPIKKETSDIPQNYLASMNLVRDLASHKNVTPKEDIVKIVNYFTVSYDIDNMNIGEPKSSIDLTEKSIDRDADGLNELGNIDETNICIEEVLKQCKYCYDTIKKIDIESADWAYKVRNCMDNTESKNGETNMSSRQDIVKKSVTLNFCDSTFDEPNERIVVASESRNSSDYAPVKHHWFYRVDCEGKSIWRGFSVADSRALENAYNSPDLNEATLVATDGGRFDVNVVGRLRIPVYWTDKPTNVMRCSWFYKGNIDARYVPYAESDAEKLEEEYRHGVTTGEWHRRLMLPNNEMVVMHGPAVMVHFLQASPTDGFGSTPLFTFGKRVYRNPPKIKVAGDQPNKIDHLILLVHGAGEYRHQKEKIQSTMRPRVVRRGYVESEIEDTEPSSIDHLLLLCHGVGSACDMRFRSVEEVVDDFRTTSLQLIQSHYKNSYDSGVIGRVEVLPISWHSSLHSGETGVDRRLAAVTLESIPRLRNFTNDTILDVLFYTSPVYCQTIVDTVCKELNRIYKLFKTRNPDFKGGVSLGGHSLGSVILYDLLCHQTHESVKASSPTKHYVRGSAGTGQPTVMYPALVFQPDALYALGSPIAIFECIRGVETLGQDFCLPTCRNFFNIFHPYDPIAYRLEPMINPLLRDVKPSLIPHHKGRKRMHLELKDTMARVGADIKQKLIESIRSTWSSMWRTSPPPEQHLEKVVEEMEKEELTSDSKDEHREYEATPDTLGRLNNGRRIDHVLQEAPFEIFNEYLFAMTSHVCYWESEDTMLVMLREIYNTLGISPDCSLPQHTMTVERSRLLDDPDNPTASSDFPSTSRGTS